MWGRRGAGRARGARRRLAAVLLLLALAAPAGAGAGRGPLAYHAVVVNGATLGSAFLLADGLAVTNRHVLRGRLPGEAVALVAADGRRVAATVLALSPWMDLAVLGVPAGFLPEVGPEDAPERDGLAVTAAGLDAADDARREAAGEVVAARAEVPAYGPGLIARLPGAAPGFSGGPLLDGEARLVGMVTALREGPGREVFALRAAAVRAEVRRLVGPLARW